MTYRSVAKDALVIAETARLRRDLTELRTPDELVVQLSRLVGHRTDLMADWVRGVNITATGGDLTAFGSAARLAAYAGLAPVPNDSGKRNGVLHRPKRYHRRLCYVFCMAAFSSLKREGPSRTFYLRKRAERQRHTKAMIALARRLVDVLWAMLRDNKPWTAPTPALATA